MKKQNIPENETTVDDVLAMAGLESLYDLAELENDRYHHTLYLGVRPSEPDAKGQVTWAAVDAHVHVAASASEYQTTDETQTDDQLVALWSGGGNGNWEAPEPGDCDSPHREGGCGKCPDFSSCPVSDDWTETTRQSLQEALDKALKTTGEVAQ